MHYYYGKSIIVSFMERLCFPFLYRRSHYTTHNSAWLECQYKTLRENDNLPTEDTLYLSHSSISCSFLTSKKRTTSQQKVSHLIKQ